MALEVLLEYAILTFLKLDFRLEDIRSGLILNVFSAVIAGIIGGSVLVFLWNGWLRSLSYGRSLLAIFFTFTLIFFLIYFLVSFYSESENMYEGLYPKGLSLFRLFPVFITYFKWLLISLFTLFLLQVNDKYGPGVLKNFILGKYFHPKLEERVFMLLDLRSATTIAEELGEFNYFLFLKACFRTITPAVIESKGDIYQYVGDELVISWAVNKKFKVERCINAYFLMQEALNQEPHFHTTFGIKPFFKAGLHGGKVMAGEIGIIKREIAFSGDVLNTTSRIQSKCNAYNAGLLVSSYISDSVTDPSVAVYEEIGDVELEGKKNSIKLFKVIYPMS